MTPDRPSTQTDETEPARKPYNKPQLVQYGDIREITRATGGVVGMNDGGAGKDKTG